MEQASSKQEDGEIKSHLVKLEVELQAKNQMVESRESTIEELRQNLDGIRQQQKIEMDKLKG